MINSKSGSLKTIENVLERIRIYIFSFKIMNKILCMSLQNNSALGDI